MWIWSRSAAGNLTTGRGSIRMTVFPAKRGGYTAVVSAEGGWRVFTKTRLTAAEACQDAIQRYEAVKDLFAAPDHPAWDDEPAERPALPDPNYDDDIPF